MKKIVNGIEVEMTPEEISAREAEEEAWNNRPPPDWDALDTAEINRMLLDDGSVVRAGLEILFGVIKGTIPVTPALTKAQFVAMLKARIRT